MSLKKESFPTIPLLMKSLINLELVPTIPHLIEEVPNFKGFVVGCITEEDEALKGLIKAQQFKFVVDSNACHIMKYRIHYTDNDWLPKEDSGINLWQENKEGRPLWPHEKPAAISA